MKNIQYKRVYKCSFCGGDVVKSPCPSNQKGLGKWKCINRRCTRPATSINKAGAMNRFTRDDKVFTDMQPSNTGQSPRARVTVKLVKIEG